MWNWFYKTHPTVCRIKIRHQDRVYLDVKEELHPNVMLQIFAIIGDTSVMNFRKNLQHNFPKMRGGVKGRLELFRKFIRFGRGKLP